MILIIDFISQPWHWAFSGAMLSVLSGLMLYSGERFGISSSFETICSMGGAGKKIELFNYDWKTQKWLLVFVAGTILGGFVGVEFLGSPEPVQISQSTQTYLQSVGINVPETKAEGLGFVPMEIFNLKNLTQPKGLIIMILGGFLIGFGTRYAKGCTSGHAISGLSNLQLPSLIAVIGFFIGGLIMTHLLLPVILTI